MEDTATKFFDACETGKGSEGCSQYFIEGATFFCECLPTMTSLSAYVDWMKDLANITMPGCSYEMIGSPCFGKNTASFSAYFKGTHTGPGGPVEPTGKSTVSQYTYVMEFNDDGKIIKMTKIWNNDYAFKELGWA